MKNSADQGGCYPQRPKAEVDNTLRDLQNSSYPTKAEFNNCFIIHSKYLLVLRGVSPFPSLFFRSPNITQPCPQVFAVNDSIIFSGLHFWRHFDVNGSIIFGGLHFWRHWFNMAKILPNLVNSSWLWWIMLVAFKPIRNGEIFWMNNNFQYFARHALTSLGNVYNLEKKLQFKQPRQKNLYSIRQQDSWPMEKSNTGSPQFTDFPSLWTC